VNGEIDTTADTRRARSLEPALASLVRQRAPGAELVAVDPLGSDASGQGTSRKAMGYGRPLRLTLRMPDGALERWVLHTAAANEFGHDRRADRAAEMLLAYDTFDAIPQHVRALDVGAIGRDGHLVSLRDAGEAYLLTRWAEGHTYAEELRAIVRRGKAEERDVDRVLALAEYLASLHVAQHGRTAYLRAARDLVGSGEGIFGIIDGYPSNVPGAPPERLEAIEACCVAWRWRLKARLGRLSRVHGDFHPFNVVFDDEGELVLLDASRGSLGEPADDLTAMAVNYLFFALSAEGGRDAFRRLWRVLWRHYFSLRPDEEMLEVAPPYLAWRTLVLANPNWYPDVDEALRDRLLGFAEDALERGGLDLAAAEELMT
jgi:hypothetical protein